MLCVLGFWDAGRFFFCGIFLTSSVSLISKRNAWKRDSNNFMGATSCGVSPTDMNIIYAMRVFINSQNSQRFTNNMCNAYKVHKEAPPENPGGAFIFLIISFRK